MDDDDFYDMHHDANVFIEAMMYAGGFRIKNSTKQRYNSSPNLSPVRKRNISPEYRKGEVQVLPCERFHGRRVNYSEIAEKNACELIREEEQIRLKAAKKKAKKQKQRQKKKELNENDLAASINNDTKINNTSNDIGKLSLNSDNRDSESLDLNAAFVSKAVKKFNIAPVIPEKPQEKNEVKDINSIIKSAIGYEKSQHYKEAVQYLSDAINLAPKRFDLILKRSFIYYELTKYEKSIQDAQKVLQYSPKNSDAYYRLGEAHFALNNLMEAETAFTKLISLNSYINEAKQRLFSIQIKHLENMGYHHNEAFTALINTKNKTLNEALDFLTAIKNEEETDEDVYYSDKDESEESEEEDENEEEGSDHAEGARGNFEANAPKPTIVLDKRSKILIDPSNPLKCCSLFVGNLKEGITNQELNDVFTKFGDIKSIKLTAETNCCYAFVNYMESSAAGQAMKALQGSRWLLSTVPLLIKYPTNIINTIIPTLKDPELIDMLKSSLTSVVKPTAVQPCVMKGSSTVKSFGGTKPRPSPKTEECYFWRTTGCDYGESCFNLHIPANQGIALNVRKSIFS